LLSQKNYRSLNDPKDLVNSWHNILTVNAMNIRLTDQERKVLTLISKGLDSKGASDVMFVGKRTVDFHLQNAYKKLEVKNRVQAINKATALKLIPFPAE
jgi:DNA-binding NarL/FixJ family response regulator